MINVRLTNRPKLLLINGLLLALPLSAGAQDVAGRVISTVGEVVALREEISERILGRGDNVYVGDRMMTAENGRAQIRFIDDGLVDLRPNSAFEVVEYEEADDQQSGSAAMEFTAGALRTITGRIGNRPDDEYDLSTDFASVGIRGTDYSLQLCDFDCAQNGQPEGLYGRVDDGIVAITNQTGTTEFSENQYFFVESEDLMPQLLPAPPQNILDGSDDGETAEETTEEDDENSVPSELAETNDNGSNIQQDDVGVTVDTNFVSAENNPNSVPLVNRAMAGIGFTSTTNQVSLFGGLIREGEDFDGAFTANEAGEVTGADFADGWSVTNTENAILESVQVWQSSTSDATVYGGTWNLDAEPDPDNFVTGTGPDGENFSAPVFSFVFSEDITTPDQLVDLTGTIDYAALDSIVISNREDTENWDDWNIQELNMTVNFSDIEVSEFELEMIDDNNKISSSMSGISIDSLFLLDFDFAGDWLEMVAEDQDSGAITGSFNGQLVGETADGLIFTLDIDRLSDADREVLESIVGTGLLVENLE